MSITIHRIEHKRGELRRLLATHGPLTVELKAVRGSRVGTEAWTARARHEAEGTVARTPWRSEAAVMAYLVALGILRAHMHLTNRRDLIEDIDAARDAAKRADWRTA